MNLPNKLTILRVIMIPVFIAVLFIEAIPYRFVIAAAIYAAASITDLLDGKIARKNNLVTDFGKLLDPLADKIFVSTALICIVSFTVAKPWNIIMPIAVAVIIAREFLVTSLRLLVANKGVVVPAAKLGKWKTTFQMIAIIVILLENQFSDFHNDMFGFDHLVGYTALGIAVILTVISCVQYVRMYSPYIDPKE